MDCITPAPRDAWAEVLARSPEALAFHRPEWLDAIVASGGYADASRLYVDGSTRAILPIARRAGLLGRTGLLASLPYGWGFGGLLVDGPIDARLAAAVARDLAAQPWARISIRPSPDSEAPWSAAMPGHAIRVPRSAHVLSLEGGFDAVWAGRFTGAARRYVRIAERSGLAVERGGGPEQLDLFYRLYLRSVERWARDAGPAPARWWVAHRREARRKFELAATALGDDLAIWTARTTEGPVAAIVVLRQGSAASYWRGAMDEAAAGRTRANDLLHRLAIEEACQAGCRTYHMGETGTSASLAQFKTRFGARPVAYAEYRLERLPLTLVASQARRLAEVGVRLLGPRGASQSSRAIPESEEAGAGQQR